MNGFEKLGGKRSSTSWIAVLGLLFVGLSQGCTPWLTDVEVIADPEAALRREVEVNRIPSLAAGVVRDGALVWEEYLGVADLATGRPADRGTVYGLASVSKLIVATAVMQLHEQGSIDLDANVDGYLPFSVRNPAFPTNPVTARNLLTHTSGLNWPESEAEVPGFYADFQMDAAPPLEEWLPQFLLPQGESFAPAVWLRVPPGSREYYSNMGVALLAYVVEFVSGTDFNVYCRSHIFGPLEMYSTSFAYRDLNMDDVATPYGPTRDPLPHTRNRAYPSGDLKTTIEDFSHFIIAYMNGGRYGNVRILNEATVRDVLTIRNVVSGTALIWQGSVGGWYGHEGGKPGVAAFVEIQPEHGVGLIVVSNYRHNSVYPGGKIHAILRRIADQR